ncbi:MAG: DUF4988 domain-containing protein [Alistipes sp.]|jgi:outer membrane murein-binding lipoprotein Lpp|nr:DUF4988 domain-containing protein [Alistipes sp.]
MKTIKRIAVASALTLVVAGCTSDLKSDIDDLKNDVDDLRVRVETLEGLVDALDQKVGEGTLISKVEPLAAPKAGWLVTFSDGKTIEINHGEKGADGETGDDGEKGAAGTTPKIEIKTNADGSVTVWVDGVDSGIDLKGPAGDGTAPQIEVRTNDDGTISVWYNVGEGWVDTGVDISAPTQDDPHPLQTIVENADGSITFILNDEEGTTDTVERVSEAVHLQVMNTATVALVGKQSGAVTFRVNPSDAWIPTGVAVDRWELDQYATTDVAGSEGTTRASYVNPSRVFSVVSLLPDGDKAGQYVATVSGDFGAHTPGTGEYVMALVFNNTESTAVDHSHISSSPFRLTIAQGREGQTGEVTYDEGEDNYDF